MVLVIEMDVLSKFQEAQMQELLSLTAKDQIYLITREDGVLPVSMLPLFTKISAKLEVKTLPKGDFGFAKGFLYGSLSKSAGKDKVIILSDENAPATLDENCSWNEGFGMKPKRKAARIPKAEPSNAAKASSDAAKKPTVTAEPSASASKLFSSPAVAGCAELIKGKEETFRKCLADASDAEIGYKMLLGLNFGTEGDLIWEQTRKHFKQLRKLL